jgi:hypothetical protein
MKYLFKYVYKGSDRINIRRDDNNNQQQQQQQDEISNYISCRYVGPCEAFHRILGFGMQEQFPNVIRIPVDLPNGQSVTFEPQTATEALNRSSTSNCILKYFALVESERNLNTPPPTPNALTLTYSKLGDQYWWDTKTWKRRQKKSEAITRMYTVHPKDKERFYLRILLSYRVNIASWKEMKTVEAFTYNSFEETCKALNLLADDQEWINTIHEAKGYMSEVSLRQLFAYILFHNDPNHGFLIYKTFKQDCSRDFRNKRRLMYTDINNNNADDENDFIQIDYDRALWAMEDDLNI